MEVQATFWHSNILEQNKLSTRIFLSSKCRPLSGFSIMQEGNFARCLQVGKTDPLPGGKVFVMVRMDKHHQCYTTSAHSQYVLNAHTFFL